MENIHYGVAWYQKKIGSYDKQLWEQSVEQKVLKGLQQAPRRSVSLKLKSELIDVDLVRGSTFSKAKPQVSWTYITHKAITRVIFFPFFYKWWLQQTSLKFWLFLLCLYTLQVVTTLIFFRNVGVSVSQDEFSLSEVVIPGLLMLILGLIHSQTVLSHISHRTLLHRDGKHMSRDGKSRKKNYSGFKKKNSSEQLGNHCENEIKTNASESQQKVSPECGKLAEDSGVILTSTDYSNGKDTHSDREALCECFVEEDSKESLLSKSSGDVSASELSLRENKVVTSDSKTVSWSDEYTTSGSLKHGHESQDSEEPREDDSHEEIEMSDDETNGKFEILSVDKDSLEALNKKRELCENSSVGLSLPEKTDGTLLFPENNKIHLKNNLVVNTLDKQRKNQSCENVYNGSKLQDEVSKVPYSAHGKEEDADENKKPIKDKTQNDEELKELKRCDVIEAYKNLRSSESKESKENSEQDIDYGLLDTAVKNFSDSDLLIKNNLMENKENIYCDSFGFNSFTNVQNDVTNSEKDVDKSTSRGYLPTRSRSLSGQFRTQGIKRVVKNRKIKHETGSETENDSMTLKSFKGLRRRKIPGDESSESGYNYFRSRRAPPTSLKLNYTKESTGISSSEGENSPMTTNPDASKCNEIVLHDL